MRLVLSLVLLVAAAVPAHAALFTCNKSVHAVNVAVGHFDGVHWSSRGWWQVAAGKCAELVRGPLVARYYYLYASDGASGAWEGSTRFCVAAAAQFSIAGRGDCAAHGYDSRGFFEVDTGNQLSWTQTLSD